MQRITAGAFAKPRGRIEREAEALNRLRIWAREMITAKEGWLTARSLRHAAGVESRSGAVLKALFRVTLHETGHPAHSGRRNHRPQWVHCSSGMTEGRNDDCTLNRR